VPLAARLAVDGAERAAAEARASRSARVGVCPTLADSFGASVHLTGTRSKPRDADDDDDDDAPAPFVWCPLLDDGAKVRELVELSTSAGDDVGGQGTEQDDDDDGGGGGHGAPPPLRVGPSPSGAGAALLSAAVSAVVELRPRALGVAFSPELLRYARELCTATRSHPLLARGASVSAERSVLAGAAARATLDGRGFAVPDDVSSAALVCLPHRMEMRPRAELRFLRVDDSALDDSWLTGRAASPRAAAAGEAAAPPGRMASPLDVLRSVLSSLRQPQPMAVLVPESKP